MRKKFMLISLALSFVAVLCVTYSRVDTARASLETEEAFTIDVACDGRTYRQNNIDPAATGARRGDTFIVEGKIYPVGTIPVGKDVFSPDRPGSIGTWICRGVWLVNAEQLAAGVSPAFDTTQIYLLPDESNQLISEGLEGPMPTLRAVIGGTGSREGTVGEVRQVLLGTNVTGLFNFRFTFRVRKESD